MRTSAEGAVTQATLSESTWENIKTPGTYVERSTGHLFRFPPEALLRGSSPIVGKVSQHQSTFIKLSDDPNMILSAARAVAANSDVKPNF